MGAPIHLMLLALLTLAAAGAVGQAAASVEVDPLGNGTIAVRGPPGAACNLSYRVVGDAEWVDAGSFTNQTSIHLPWGEYVFSVSCSGNESFRGVVANQPRWMFMDSLIYLSALSMIVVLHFWRRSIATAALSIVLFWNYIYSYMETLTPGQQGLLLTGFTLLMLLLAIWGRR